MISRASRLACLLALFLVLAIPCSAQFTAMTNRSVRVPKVRKETRLLRQIHSQQILTRATGPNVRNRSIREKIKSRSRLVPISTLYPLRHTGPRVKNERIATRRIRGKGSRIDMTDLD